MKDFLKKYYGVIIGIVVLAAFALIAKLKFHKTEHLENLDGGGNPDGTLYDVNGNISTDGTGLSYDDFLALAVQYSTDSPNSSNNSDGNSGGGGGGGGGQNPSYNPGLPVSTYNMPLLPGNVITLPSGIQVTTTTTGIQTPRGHFTIPHGGITPVTPIIKNNVSTARKKR